MLNVVFSSLALLSSTAEPDATAPSAEEPASASTSGEPPEPPEPLNGVSFRALAGVAHVDNGFPLLGVGVAYERSIAEGLLAAEVAIEGLTSPEAAGLLIEFVLEKPIELTDGAELYFGGGPTIAIHDFTRRNETDVGFGGLVLLGVEVALGGGVAAFVELDMALLILDEAVIESDIGSGLMWRF